HRSAQRLLPRTCSEISAWAVPADGPGCTRFRSGSFSRPLRSVVRRAASGGAGSPYHASRRIEALANRASGALAATERPLSRPGGLMTRSSKGGAHRVDRRSGPTVRNWGDPTSSFEGEPLQANSLVECGRGRILFGPTF